MMIIVEYSMQHTLDKSCSVYRVLAAASLFAGLLAMI